MSQVSYYISVNRGFVFLGFAVGVFLQLAIIYQLYFFYGADTNLFSFVIFGVPLAAAFFQGILIVNFAKALTEKNQARTLTLRQFSISALITALIFYGIYLGVAPGILRLLNRSDIVSFAYKAGFFEMISLIVLYIVIWLVTRKF